MEQVIDNGIIVRNVSSRTVLPKMEQIEIRFFTLDEQKRFIDALPDSTGGRALYFILGTGIRDFSHIVHLQSAHYKEAMRNRNPDA